MVAHGAILTRFWLYSHFEGEQLDQDGEVSAAPGPADNRAYLEAQKGWHVAPELNCALVWWKYLGNFMLFSRC